MTKNSATKDHELHQNQRPELCNEDGKTGKAGETVILNLIRQLGFEGLRTITREAQWMSSEETAKIESQNSPEVLIVGPKSSFRAQIFAYTKGEIILENSLPDDFLQLPRFELAIFRERILADRDTEGRRQVERESLVLKGSPVSPTSKKKLKILQMNLDQFQRLQSLMKV